MYGEKRFYHNPKFQIIAWTLFALGFYLYFTSRIGEVSLFTMRDAIIFILELIFWFAFFAQFILPVQSFKDRLQIFNRIILYLTGGHGPAIFTENGKRHGREGEVKRYGPGVIWLDTASAAVLRTPTEYTRAIGPGIHYTKRNEYIAGIIDLHSQVQTIGPLEEDKPFTEKKGGQSEADYRLVQNRRMEVSGLTRDGIEIVPNIVVSFKIDADPAKGDMPGSHFGYDQAAVFKAVCGEGVNPSASPDTPNYRVAWNQLPARLAVDLWREYLSKFTLSQLFEASQTIPEDDGTYELDLESIAALSHPVQTVQQVEGFHKSIVDILSVLNEAAEKILLMCGGNLGDQHGDHQEISKANRKKDNKSREKVVEDQVTALQIISHMIKDRLQKPSVLKLKDFGNYLDKELNEFGRLAHPRQKSDEYQILMNRGVRVLSVSINNLRFNPTIEEQLVRQFTVTWLETAKQEREGVNRLRSAWEINGKERALQEHAEAISRELDQALKKNGSQAPRVHETVKTLLSATRTEIIRNNKLHQRLGTEIDELTEIIQWVDKINLP